MGLITNEQSEKGSSLFLRYEADNNLSILSNLYKVDFHYLKPQNKFVGCDGEECIFCENGYKKGTEYNYYVILNGNKGIMDIKPSVFFAINAIERASKKDKRKMTWLVLKSGEGLSTKYNVSKDDNLSDSDWKKAEEELPKYNKMLETYMESRENQLKDAYGQYSVNVERQEIPLPSEVGEDDVPVDL